MHMPRNDQSRRLCHACGRRVAVLPTGLLERHGRSGSCPSSLTIPPGPDGSVQAELFHAQDLPPHQP